MESADKMLKRIEKYDDGRREWKEDKEKAEIEKIKTIKEEKSD